jgi:spatzle-processing enzyme
LIKEFPAAHCTHQAVLSSKKWKLNGVRLGEWDLGQDLDCETSFNGQNKCAPAPLDLEIAENRVHEGYIPFDVNQKNDIAIIKLRSSVEFNDFVR